VIFNAAIAVWPMVALNVTLTAINVFYIVRLLRGRHGSRTSEVVEIFPNEAYLKNVLHEFDAGIQHFNPGFLVRMPLAPSSVSSSSTQRRRWVWCWRETQVTDQPRSTSTTWYRDIKASPWATTSIVPAVRSSHEATEE
jgi:hypothetical protein